ncbi:hypothetical protein [Nonomuraea rubra]|uniref:hypothetical protein n=1 Tax=Nonomuraea rubra TaxID=46180 RepID=UPI0033FA177E
MNGRDRMSEAIRAAYREVEAELELELRARLDRDRLFVGVSPGYEQISQTAAAVRLARLARRVLGRLLDLPPRIAKTRSPPLAPGSRPPARRRARPGPCCAIATRSATGSAGCGT